MLEELTAKFTSMSELNYCPKYIFNIPICVKISWKQEETVNRILYISQLTSKSWLLGYMRVSIIIICGFFSGMVIFSEISLVSNKQSLTAFHLSGQKLESMLIILSLDRLSTKVTSFQHNSNLKNTKLQIFMTLDQVCFHWTKWYIYSPMKEY